MKLSVALCTYNGSRYIEKQLLSIINQTIVPDEIIICDDRSSDNTVQIIENFIKTHPDINIKIFINESSLRTIKNFEKAVSLCSGDWLFLSDQDDMWKKNKVEKMLNFIAQNSETLLLFTDGQLVDENDSNLESSLWEKWKFNPEIRKKWLNNENAFEDLVHNKNYVTGATVMISRKLLKDTLPFDIPKGYYHDCWLAVNAAGLNGLRYMNECLIDYRIHQQQQVGITSGGNDISNIMIETNISQKQYIKKLYRKYTPKKLNLFQRLISNLYK
ncbi:glycosyltransferase family 2 protein [Chryseobacterium piperi]|uniref:glycosyltransferase family 2 protein n=1 Tax=Chryseobacterium piperi TaxID=558152 RepID=UPI0006897128|nr:glycosyltransferase family 2 protein [Chryseobacterium piperi]ASW75055.1 glycosyltransferase family 2 protein [Chryseobacterium piperi]